MDYRDEALEIHYPGGAMLINLKEFFPCSGAKLKKLIKLAWKRDDLNRIRTAKETIGYLEARITENEKDPPFFANAAVDKKTKAVKMQEGIDRQAALVDKMIDRKAEVIPAKKKEYREILKAEKEKLREMKSQQKEMMAGYRFYNAEFTKAKSRIERLKENVEILKGYLEAWE